MQTNIFHKDYIYLISISICLHIYNTIHTPHLYINLVQMHFKYMKTTEERLDTMNNTIPTVFTCY